MGGPYDTLEEVIGIRPSAGSLKEYGVSYRQVDLLPDGSFDYDGIRAAIGPQTKLITIQRSKGYATRPSFSVDQIGQLIAFCKQCKPDVICMVDNCYGEFTELREPSDVGADMIVGSLIKNPGGGLAPTGGYVCGRADLHRPLRPPPVRPGSWAGGRRQSWPADPAVSGVFPVPHRDGLRRKGCGVCRRPAMKSWASAWCPPPPRPATTSSRPWSWAAARAWWPSARVSSPPRRWTAM